METHDELRALKTTITEQPGEIYNLDSTVNFLRFGRERKIPQVVYILRISTTLDNAHFPPTAVTRIYRQEKTIPDEQFDHSDTLNLIPDHYKIVTDKINQYRKTGR